MIKEKEKKKRMKKSLPKQIITIQSQFRGKLWLFYKFESFHWISLLVLLNYVQMMEVHTYIWMCIAKLKCFLSLKIISSFSESVSWLILLLPFCAMPVRGYSSSKDHPWLPGTKTTFHDSLDCLQGQQTQRFLVYRRMRPQNWGPIALGFLLRLENGSTSQDHLYQTVHKKTSFTLRDLNKREKFNKLGKQKARNKRKTDNN